MVLETLKRCDVVMIVMGDVDIECVLHTTT